MSKTKQRGVRRAAYVVAITMSQLMSMAASADSATATDPDAINGTGTDRLEEIVVTARKRAENLQDVPVSISAFTANDLAQEQIITPSDLQFHTPGLEIRNNGLVRANNQYFIRGQGETFGSAPSVVTYFAEAVASQDNIGNNGQFFDINNIQVLKGPQGTLFGRSTTGGAVLVTPQRPTNDFDGWVDVTQGNFQYGQYTAVLNVPLVDGKLSARLAANVLRRQGFTQSLSTGQALDNWDRDSYRLSLNFTPTDWLASYLLFQDNRADENNTGTVLTYFNTNNITGAASPSSPYNTTPFAGAGWFGIALPPGLSPALPGGGLCYQINPTNPVAAQACINQRLGILNNLRNALIGEINRVTTGRLNAIRYDQTGSDLQMIGHNQQLTNITSVDLGHQSFLGDVTIKNIFGTSRDLGSTWKYDGGSPIPNGLVYNQFSLASFVPYSSDATNDHDNWLDQFSEEFQIQGVVGKTNWLVGYYLEENSRAIAQPPMFAAYGNVFNPGLNPSVVSDYTTDFLDLQRGVFAQTTVDLSDWVLNGLSVTGGYRWSWTHQREIARSFVLSPTGNLSIGGVDTVTPIPTVNNQAPSSNVSFEYQMNKEMLVYLAHRLGFKPGGANTTPTVVVPGYRPIYDPETVQDAEVGIKADWLIDNHALRTNADIYKEWYSNIQRSETLVLPGGVPYTQTNNIAKAQIEGFELSTTYQATQNLQLSLTYSFINPRYTSWPGTTVNNITGVVEPLIESPYVGTPKHQGTLGARYDLPVAASLGLMSLYAEYYRQSKVDLNDTTLADNGIGWQSGYENTNLRFDWANVLGRPFDVSAFVRNITDEVHANSINSFLSIIGTMNTVYSEPRMYGVEVRWRFGHGAIQQ
jgi:iron complex outermembrane receptor protein